MTEYGDLKQYRGDKIACSNCGRSFSQGEAISVASTHDLAFCYSDAMGGCGPAYIFSNPDVGMMMFDPMRFGSEMVESEQQMPNYPNSPVFEHTHDHPAPPKRRWWWQRLLC